MASCNLSYRKIGTTTSVRGAALDNRRKAKDTNKAPPLKIRRASHLSAPVDPFSLEAIHES